MLPQNAHYGLVSNKSLGIYG